MLVLGVCMTTAAYVPCVNVPTTEVMGSIEHCDKCA